MILRIIYVGLLRLFKESSKFRFLCIGGNEVKKYYCSIGFKKALFFQFGYFPAQNLVTKRTFNSSSIIKFIFIGQLIPRKGVDILIRAIRYLQSKYSNWEILIVGDGILKDKISEVCRDDKRVSFIENIQDPQKIKLHFDSSHILFLPSYFDGWGAVVNEALSSCCSLLLSSNVYAGKSLLKEGENGFRFNPYAIEELYAAIDKYFDNSQILNSHFNNSEKIFKEWNHINAAMSFNNMLIGIDSTCNKTLLKTI